jgi:hypothetical protein
VSPRLHVPPTPARSILHCPPAALIAKCPPLLVSFCVHRFGVRWCAGALFPTLPPACPLPSVPGAPYVPGPRRVYGMALGVCPTERIFNAYLALETSLANYDRARKIYEKYLETMPFNCSAWSKVGSGCRFLAFCGDVGVIVRPCRSLPGSPTFPSPLGPGLPVWMARCLPGTLPCFVIEPCTVCGDGKQRGRSGPQPRHLRVGHQSARAGHAGAAVEELHRL